MVSMEEITLPSIAMRIVKKMSVIGVASWCYVKICFDKLVRWKSVDGGCRWMLRSHTLKGYGF